MPRNLKLRRTIQSKVSIPIAAALAELAKQEDVTVSTFVRRLIEQRVASAHTTESAPALRKAAQP